MLLETHTLLVITALNLLMVSLTLPVLMGRGASAAARYIQGGLLAQMFAWVMIIASDYGFDREFSTGFVTCNALSQWLFFRAMAGWLGPRPGERLLVAMMVVAPIGYFIGFSNYPFRVGWANFLLGAEILVAARATLWPRRPAARRWRWLLAACMLMMAFFTVARGVLGAFFTPLYPSFHAPHPVNLGSLLALNVSVVLGTIAMLVAWREEVEQTVHQMAMTDPLTGILNRRGFTVQALPMLAQARRHHWPVVALMLDLDFFKHVNDTHGHEVGDRTLQLFAQVLKECQRVGDLVGRLGGEEFGVLLTHADAAAAQLFDQRLRARLAQAAVPALGFAVDFSAGMAVYVGDDVDLATLLARADKGLYMAKEEGRGRMLAA